MKINYFILPLLLIAIITKAQNSDNQKTEINTLIDTWHNAAAQANFETYFSMMSDNSIFIGTDATENWSKKEFQAYAKPYFDKGKVWNFKAVQRNIFFSEDQKTAWFDELLDTQMKICRGSGVLIKVNEKWKIAHYVLSISIPNEISAAVVNIKTDFDDTLLKKLKSR